MPLTSHRQPPPARLLTSALVALVVMALASPAYSATPATGASRQTASGGSALTPELPADVVKASFARGGTWTPETAVYGTTSTNDVPVTMSDGIILRANVIYPTDPATGKIASGPFPVILSQTPHGKGTGGSSAPGSAQNPGGESATGGPELLGATRLH